MKKFIVVLLAVVIMASPLQITWAEEQFLEATEEPFDVAAWDKDITQRFANVAYSEDFPYKFYEVEEEEHYSSVTGTSYTSRSSKFTIAGAWLSSFTINYDLYDRGFDVYFNDEEKSSTIKDFLTATLMVVYGATRDEANEFVDDLVPTYDGIHRSDYIYSDDMVVYLRKSVIGGTEVVASEREYFQDRKTDGYQEMTYDDLKARLNQGEYGMFTGTVTSIAKGEDEDTITIQMESGNNVVAYLGFASYHKPYIMNTGKDYSFYVYIVEPNSYRTAGDIQINCIYEK